MNYLIGLDIGTSSVKGVLMTTEGKILKTAKGVFSYHTSGADVVELDPQTYLEVCFQTLRELASAAADGVIKGVCASSASGNLLVLDENHRPATAIIGWQDHRVSQEARELLGDMDLDAFYRRIGWPFSYQTFPLAQLCRLKKQDPGLIARCSAVCMSTEYLYYTLTGKWGISSSAGTTFYLIDQQKGRYIEELLVLLEIPPEKLPPILPCGQVLGQVTPEASPLCGLPAGTPVVLGSFDHPSAARGVGVLQEGEMLLSCGTSWVALFPLSSREKGLAARMLVDPFLAPGGCWAGMTSLASLSGRIQHYVHRYLDDSPEAFRKLSALAAQCPPGANGLRIDPRQDPDDENILAHSPQEIARAIMEGTVFLLKERLDCLAEKGICARKAVMVGGPSEDSFWIFLIEEICGISVRVIHGAFAGAVGAAVMAGIGTGEYRDETEAHKIFERSTLK